MESILKSVKRKKIPINPAVVISNKRNAKGLQIARKLGASTEIVESKRFNGSRAEYDREVMAVLSRYGVTPRNGIVCLAGFMRVVGPEFVKRYKNKIVNIHPSLLPSFPGLNAQKQALEYGAKYSGCTVHFVDEGTDTGPIIIQAAVKVDQKDTVDSLSKKILKKEHIIYPQAVDLLVKKKIRIVNRKILQQV